MTATERRVVKALQAGWTVWAPHRALMAYAVSNRPLQAVPNAHGELRSFRVRKSTLDRMVSADVLDEHVGKGEFPDVEWKLVKR